MPRPREFDADEAAARAMETFWEHGYTETSIADLIEATGVQRQSLYNALGTKDEMFLRALVKYDAEIRRAHFAALEAKLEPLDALRELFRGTAEACETGTSLLGCLIVNTAIELPAHAPEVQHVVRCAVDDMRITIQRWIEQGKLRGQIAESVDAPSVAAALLGTLMGMRALGRGAANRTMLDEMARAVLTLVVPTER